MDWTTGLSGTGEQRGAQVDGTIAVPAWGLVTVRAERWRIPGSLTPGMTQKHKKLRL